MACCFSGSSPRSVSGTSATLSGGGVALVVYTAGVESRQEVRVVHAGADWSLAFPGASVAGAC